MNEELSDLESSTNLSNKFDKEIFKKYFPNSKFFSAYYAGKITGKFSFNGLFDETKYYTDKKQSLIHFTSLQSLTSILKEGYFKLSEFRNFEDKSELSYASEIFSKNQDMENKKNNFFVLSTCEKTLRDPYMWEKYGNKGKGAIIQFKLNYNKTVEFLLGQVLYGHTGLEILENSKISLEKFKDENNGFEFNFFHEIIVEILAYHKQAKYQHENEIRLFFKQNKNEYIDHNHIAIDKDITHNTNQVRYFFKMFLNERKLILEEEINNQKETDEFFKFYPTIEIERIIIGNDLEENKIDIYDLLSELKQKYKYDYKLWQHTYENNIQESNGY